MNTNISKKYAKIHIHHDGTFVQHCKNLGEVNLYGYIILSYGHHNMTGGCWYYSDFVAQMLMERYDWGRSTIFRYLKNLCTGKPDRPALLFRLQKGVYQLNPHYVTFPK